MLHRKESNTVSSISSDTLNGTTAPDHITQHLQARNNGSTLPAQTRAAMEGVFGTDLSGVRIHTDAKAIQMNQELHARAFTHGSNIYFNKSEYHPDSAEGKHLLAHELTHVVQQGGGTHQVQMMPNIIQLLRIDYPSEVHGHLQHDANITSNHDVPWSMWVEDDVLLFKYRYLGRDAASVHIRLYDDESALWVGGGSLSWAGEANDEQLIRFTEFPLKSSGEEMDKVEAHVNLVNDSARRGIHANERVYRGW